MPWWPTYMWITTSQTKLELLMVNSTESHLVELFIEPLTVVTFLNMVLVWIANDSSARYGWILRNRCFSYCQGNTVYPGILCFVRKQSYLNKFRSWCCATWTIKLWANPSFFESEACFGWQISEKWWRLLQLWQFVICNLNMVWMLKVGVLVVFFTVGGVADSCRKILLPLLLMSLQGLLVA